MVAGTVGGRKLGVEVDDVDLGAVGQTRAHEDVVENLGVPEVDEGVAIV